VGPRYQHNELSEAESDTLQANRDFFVRESENFGEDFNTYLETFTDLSPFQDKKIVIKIKKMQIRLFHSIYDENIFGENEDDFFEIAQTYYDIGLGVFLVYRFMSFLLDFIEKKGNKFNGQFLSSVRRKIRIQEDRILYAFNEVYQASEQKIIHQAYHDSLTKLPNRHLLESRLADSFTRTDASNTLLAICIIDLDDFKSINDVYGHNAGDVLLKEFSRRIQHHLRKGDFVARLGGDEFILILEDFRNLEMMNQLTKILNRLHQTVESPFDLGNGNVVEVEISLGCAFYPIDGKDGSALIAKADSALNWAKSHKKERTVWWKVGTNNLTQHESEQTFDPYGDEANELLSAIQYSIDDIGYKLVDNFYSELVKLPDANAITSKLSDEGMNNLVFRQSEHLRFLLNPETTKEDIVDRARSLGQTHVLSGVGFGLLTLSLVLYRNTLHKIITPSIVSTRKLHKLLLISEHRLLDDIVTEIQVGESVMSEYFEIHSRIIRSNHFEFLDFAREYVNEIGKLPGIEATVFLILDLNNSFLVNHYSGTRAKEVVVTLQNLISQNALNMNLPRTLPLFQDLLHSKETRSIANVHKTTESRIASKIALIDSIRSMIFIPVMNNQDQCTGMFVLFGSCINQFESPWMRRFVRNIQINLENNWNQSS
jgi:diguanylate cyclase (GGDEF)-like protein